MYSTNSAMFYRDDAVFSNCPRGVQNRISLEAAILCSKSEQALWKRVLRDSLKHL